MPVLSDRHLPYQDLQLGPEEVRLIAIEETREPSLRHDYPGVMRTDSLRLVMRRHKLEDKPEFSAVSHV